MSTRLDSAAVTEHILSLGDFLIEELKTPRHQGLDPRGRTRCGRALSPASRFRTRTGSTNSIRRWKPGTSIRPCGTAPGLAGYGSRFITIPAGDDLDALLAALDEIMKTDGVAKSKRVLP